MMRIITVIFLLALLTSCSKDKFTNEPQIEFKRFTFNQVFLPVTNFTPTPDIVLNVTDGDGDLGIVPGKDTAFIHLKNLLTGDTAVLNFPALGSAARKNFKAEVEASLFNMLRSNPPSAPRPWVDTVLIEVYITDFNKNRSNVIVTPEPLYLISP